MATYRQLLSNKNFLKVQERAGQVGGVVLSEALYYNRELVFNTPSVSRSGTYQTKIKIKELDRRVTIGMSEAQIYDMILNSDLDVYCSCPAFKYWGYKYLSTVDGYGLNVEGRYPAIRNPKLRGYVCKHLYAVLSLYPQLVQQIRTALVPLYIPSVVIKDVSNSGRKK